MDSKQFQQEALATLQKTDLHLSAWQVQCLVGMLNLAGEAGEVVDLLKKHILHGHPMDDALRAKLKEEIGDVQWALAIIADAFGIDLAEAMQANNTKLRIRYPEGFSQEASMARVDKKLMREY